MKSDDLILAFFPCIYFCNISELNQKQGPIGSKNWPAEKLWRWKLEYSRKRQHFYELALKMTAVVELRGLRMIVENPWHEINYTNHFWFNRPAIIDKDRTERGDYFVKPTAYWFINCQPTHGFTREKTAAKDRKFVGAGGHNNAAFRSAHKTQRDRTAKGSAHGGICSEERSLIAPRYARNFISDFVLGTPCQGKPQQQDLFQ